MKHIVGLVRSSPSYMFSLGEGDEDGTVSSTFLMRPDSLDTLVCQCPYNCDARTRGVNMLQPGKPQNTVGRLPLGLDISFLELSKSFDVSKPVASSAIKWDDKVICFVRSRVF